MSEAGIETRRRSYTMIFDDLRAPGMSARAWGVYAYLSSRPDGWITRIGDLCHQFKEGRDALWTAVHELADLGLLAKVTYLEEGTHLRRAKYVMPAEHFGAAPAYPPRSAPETGFQEPGKPVSPETRPLVSTEVYPVLTSNQTPSAAVAAERVIDTDSLLTIEEVTAPPVKAPSFEDFYAAYPLRVARLEAEKAWASVVKAGADPAVIVAGARRYAADPNLPVKAYRPRPATWLRRGGWGDEPCPQRIAPEARDPRPVMLQRNDNPEGRRRFNMPA